MPHLERTHRSVLQVPHGTPWASTAFVVAFVWVTSLPRVQPGVWVMDGLLETVWRWRAATKCDLHAQWRGNDHGRLCWPHYW